jgi:hypothetical protein
MQTATRRVSPLFSVYLSLRVNPDARMDFQTVELEPLVLDGVLHAGLLEVLDDDVAELGGPDHLHRGPFLPDLGESLFLLDADRPVRRETLDRERAADADGLVVLIRLVVQHLGLGVAGDSRVDLLPCHALLDVRVVGDGLERHVRHTLVDKGLADVTLRLMWRRDFCGEFRFLLDPLRRIGQQVVPVLGRH